jgi:anhydro-N-acetylmuramic acid kinase
MHKDLIRLTKIAAADSRLIIGLMSGTSLDGLDIALCNFRGQGRSTQVKVLQFCTCAYDETLRSELKSISSKPYVDLQKVTLLHAYLGTYHAKLILEALEKWRVNPEDVDLIASHGQTIFHAPFAQHHLAPYGNATLQIGDGDHIAVKTGIITISDFRQKHIAAGGEGAPLAGYGDYLIFSSATENRVLLNIGGISNFTYLPAAQSSHKILTTDVGPGNTLMDQYVQRTFPGESYDRDGEIAASGEINQQFLAALSNIPFFKAPFPKTTGPELFNLPYVDLALKTADAEDLNPAGVLATLSALTEQSIVAAIKECIPSNQQYEIYISGGGMHNTHLLNALNLALGKQIRSTGELDVDPDAKEAVLFALLANECVTGGAAQFPSDAKMPAVAMGKISLTA